MSTGVGKNAAVLAAIGYYSQDLILRTGFTNGSYNESGRWVDGVPVEQPIRGAVINASQKDLLIVPEAERTSGMVSLYTTAIVTLGDVFEWQGNAFRVVKAYPREIGLFTKAICGNYDTVVQVDVPIPATFGGMLLEDGGLMLLEDGGILLLDVML